MEKILFEEKSELKNHIKKSESILSDKVKKLTTE